MKNTPHQPLQKLAKNQDINVNHFVDEENTTQILPESDLKKQFEIRAKRGQGKAERALQLLNELDELGL